MRCVSRLGNQFAALSRAAARHASARLRRLGAGSVAADWTARAQACARCPLRRVYGKISYCGSPFLRKPLRDPSEDGCGCPILDKARDPSAHCPLTIRHRPAVAGAGECDCKWCNLPRAAVMGD